MSLDDSGLRDLAARFENAGLEAPREIAGILVENAEFCVTITKRNTPVVDGDLRKSWERTEPVRIGDAFEVDVFSTNIAPHALWVEEGHAQHARWLPGSWNGDKFEFDPDSDDGMMLQEKFIPGQWMAKTAMAITQDRMPAMTEALAADILRKALG